MTNLDSEAQGQPSDEEKYVGYGRSLHAAVERALVPWLTSTLESRHGAELPAAVVEAITSAAQDALSNLTELIEADVDQPLSGPLEQIRRAVSTLGPVLDKHGFARPARDPYDQQMRPDDVHALGPISFMDLSEEVQSAGITWGAAKAHLHTSRRRTE